MTPHRSLLFLIPISGKKVLCCQQLSSVVGISLYRTARGCYYKRSATLRRALLASSWGAVPGYRVSQSGIHYARRLDDQNQKERQRTRVLIKGRSNFVKGLDMKKSATVPALWYSDMSTNN